LIVAIVIGYRDGRWRIPNGYAGVPWRDSCPGFSRERLRSGIWAQMSRVN